MQYDELVADKQVRREVGGITPMCAWRWDRSDKMRAIGWPAPIKIGRRTYRSRQALEAFKQNIFAGMAARAPTSPPPPTSTTPTGKREPRAAT
jgi:hypothetical protein